MNTAMCGRFSLTTDVISLQARFGFTLGEPPLVPRYNIAPTQNVLTVLQGESGLQGQMMRWGLIPSWANDEKIGNRMINARSETIAESKVFGKAFKQQRCLVIANSFFEWQKTQTGKMPVKIMLKSEEPFAFAGLWSMWTPKGEQNNPLYSCTIVTTIANSLIEPIHTRMPVILTPDAEHTWLNTSESNAPDLRELLVPYSAWSLRAYQVSSVVNSPRNDIPTCIKPVESFT